MRVREDIETATFEWEDLTGLSGVLMKPVAKKNVGPVAVARWVGRQVKRAAMALRPKRETDSKTPVDEKSVEKAPISAPSATFQIRDVSLSVPHGALWAVVGPVGSGKSSLLQGLIGGTYQFASPERVSLSLHLRDASFQGRGCLWRKGSILSSGCLDSGAFTTTLTGSTRAHPSC